MRPAPLAVVALVSAVLGGVGVLAVGQAAGWLDGGRTRTVVVRTTTGSIPASAPSRPLPAVDPPPVKPLLGGSFDPAGIYALRSPGVVTIFAYFDSSGAGEAAQGSGFVVSRAGYILTNSHVVTNAGTQQPGERVEPARRLYAEFADRDRVPATIVGWDVFDDVGLLRVDPQAHALSPVPLGDSSRVRVGEPVAAIGSPFGNENSLTVGVVSAIHRSIESLTSRYDLPDAIQTDASINRGNSGGPLFDAHGLVIGINAQIRSDSGNAEGVGFAVPINAAKRSMAELIATGRVSYAYAGIVAEDLTPTLARHLGLPAPHGALIDSVRSGAAAARAGLRGGTREEEFNGQTFRRGGDVILAIDGEQVGSAEDLVRIVTERLRPSRASTFTVLRDGRRIDVRVVLDERPPNPDVRG